MRNKKTSVWLAITALAATASAEVKDLLYATDGEKCECITEVPTSECGYLSYKLPEDVTTKCYWDGDDVSTAAACKDFENEADFQKCAPSTKKTVTTYKGLATELLWKDFMKTYHANSCPHEADLTITPVCEVQDCDTSTPVSGESCPAPAPTPVSMDLADFKIREWGYLHNGTFYSHTAAADLLTILGENESATVGVYESSCDAPTTYVLVEDCQEDCPPKPEGAVDTLTPTYHWLFKLVDNTFHDVPPSSCAWHKSLCIVSSLATPIEAANDTLCGPPLPDVQHFSFEGCTLTELYSSSTGTALPSPYVPELNADLKVILKAQKISQIFVKEFSGTDYKAVTSTFNADLGHGEVALTYDTDHFTHPQDMESLVQLFIGDDALSTFVSGCKLVLSTDLELKKDGDVVQDTHYDDVVTNYAIIKGCQATDFVFETTDQVAECSAEVLDQSKIERNVRVDKMGEVEIPTPIVTSGVFNYNFMGTSVAITDVSVAVDVTSAECHTFERIFEMSNEWKTYSEIAADKCFTLENAPVACQFKNPDFSVSVQVAEAEKVEALCPASESDLLSDQTDCIDHKCYWVLDETRSSDSHVCTTPIAVAEAKLCMASTSKTIKQECEVEVKTFEGLKAKNCDDAIHPGFTDTKTCSLTHEVTSGSCPACLYSADDDEEVSVAFDDLVDEPVCSATYKVGDLTPFTEVDTTNTAACKKDCPAFGDANAPKACVVPIKCTKDTASIECSEIPESPVCGDSLVEYKWDCTFVSSVPGFDETDENVVTAATDSEYCLKSLDVAACDTFWRCGEADSFAECEDSHYGACVPTGEDVDDVTKCFTGTQSRTVTCTNQLGSVLEDEQCVGEHGRVKPCLDSDCAELPSGTTTCKVDIESLSELTIGCNEHDHNDINSLINEDECFKKVEYTVVGCKRNGFTFAGESALIACEVSATPSTSVTVFSKKVCTGSSLVVSGGFCEPGCGLSTLQGATEKCQKGQTNLNRRNCGGFADLSCTSSESCKWEDISCDDLEYCKNFADDENVSLTHSDDRPIYTCTPENGSTCPGTAPSTSRPCPAEGRAICRIDRDEWIAGECSAVCGVDGLKQSVCATVAYHEAESTRPIPGIEPVFDGAVCTGVKPPADTCVLPAEDAHTCKNSGDCLLDVNVAACHCTSAETGFTGVLCSEPVVFSSLSVEVNDDPVSANPTVQQGDAIRFLPVTNASDNMMFKFYSGKKDGIMTLVHRDSFYNKLVGQYEAAGNYVMSVKMIFKNTLSTVKRFEYSVAPSCASKDCGRGTCSLTTGTCSCPAGYSGAQCETNDCGCVHGKCSQGVCQCDAGFEGAFCDNVSSCPASACSTNGFRQDDGDNACACMCYDFWHGDKCNTCSATCVTGTLKKDTCTCKCNEGYTGPLCDCKFADVKTLVQVDAPLSADDLKTGIKSIHASVNDLYHGDVNKPKSIVVTLKNVVRGLENFLSVKITLTNDCAPHPNISFLGSNLTTNVDTLLTAFADPNSEIRQGSLTQGYDTESKIAVSYPSCPTCFPNNIDDSETQEEDDKDNLGLIIGLAVGGAALLAIIIVIICCCCCRGGAAESKETYRKKESNMSPEQAEQQFRDLSGAPQSNNAVQMTAATTKSNMSYKPEAAPVVFTSAANPDPKEIVEVDEADEVDDEDLGPLPENWQECMTDEGHIYYWNCVTQESLWERPTE